MLEISKLSLDDLDSYYEMNKDSYTARMQGFKEFSSKKDAKISLKKMIDLNREYKITLDGKMIGIISFVPLSLAKSISTNSFIIGFALKQEYQNKGIMSDFLKDVLSYIFFLTKKDCVFVGCFLENEASKAVIEKYFTYYGDQVIYFDSLEDYKKTHVYYLKREDYIKYESENYYLKPFNVTDANDLLNLSKANLIKGVNLKSLEESKNYLKDFLINHKDRLALCQKDNNQVIAVLDIIKYNKKEINYLEFNYYSKEKDKDAVVEIVSELKKDCDILISVKELSGFVKKGNLYYFNEGF